MKRALILGITGQAGRLMAPLLTDYEVWGTTTKSSEQVPVSRHLAGVKLIYEANLAEESTRKMLLHNVARGYYDVIFNFASQMYAPRSWEACSYCMTVNSTVVATILEGMRISPRRDVTFIQAGSGEMYPHTDERKNEASDCDPSTPYGISKQVAYELVRKFRLKYDMRCSTAILFNMESGLRDDFFFARRAVKECARISIAVRANRRHRSNPPLEMAPVEFGPINAIRDWGLAREYVEAMRLMSLRKDQTDFVVATGESHSCRDFLMKCFQAAGVWWETGFRYIKFPRTRDSADDVMAAAPDKAAAGLGWVPSGFDAVVTELMLDELRAQGAPWLRQ